VIDEEKNEAIIEEIKTRKNEIKRPKIANIDQIVFIISTKSPKPDLLMLDKQLAYSEKIKIEPLLCLIFLLLNFLRIRLFYFVTLVLIHQHYLIKKKLKKVR